MKNNWPDNYTIQQYLQGSLDRKQMHELEKRALDDPFLADALEGFAQTSAADHELSILQRQLHERIAHQHENKKVFDLTWQRLSVAAAAAVMFITAGVLFWMNSQVQDDTMAVNEKRVEVSMTPVDSIPKDEALVSHSDKIPAVKEPAAKAAVRAKKSASEATVKSKIKDAVENGERLNAALLSRESNTILADKQASAAEENQQEALKPRAGDSMVMAKRSSPHYSLSEVTVSRFTASTTPEASPADGWEAYRKYLQEHTTRSAAALGQKGKVVLVFKVDPTGKIKDLQVLQGLSPAADSAAVKIIRSGPAWKAAADGKASDLKIELDF